MSPGSARTTDHAHLDAAYDEIEAMGGALATIPRTYPSGADRTRGAGARPGGRAGARRVAIRALVGLTTLVGLSIAGAPTVARTVVYGNMDQLLAPGMQAYAVSRLVPASAPWATPAAVVGTPAEGVQAARAVLYGCAGAAGDCRGEAVPVAAIRAALRDLSPERAWLRDVDPVGRLRVTGTQPENAQAARHAEWRAALGRDHATARRRLAALLLDPAERFVDLDHLSGQRAQLDNFRRLGALDASGELTAVRLDGTVAQGVAAASAWDLRLPRLSYWKQAGYLTLAQAGLDVRAGDDAAAERRLRDVLASARGMDAQGRMAVESLVAAVLARQALEALDGLWVLQGRTAEAEAVARVLRPTSAPGPLEHEAPLVAYRQAPLLLGRADLATGTKWELALSTLARTAVADVPRPEYQGAARERWVATVRAALVRSPGDEALLQMALREWPVQSSVGAQMAWMARREWSPRGR